YMDSPEKEIKPLPRSFASKRQGLSFKRKHRFAERFRERRMRVDELPHFPRRSVEQIGQARFRKQFGHMRTDHMYPQNVTGLSVGNHFHEAVRLTEHDRLSDRLERNFPRLHIMPAGSGLALRQADR